MIPFDLRYLRAESAEEAVAAWQTAADRGETAHYLGGGTEIVTLARESKLATDVVIELSRIPEASTVETVRDGDRRWLAFGATLPLNRIVDGEYRGLLGACLAGIADRTTRNSITLGGNICGMLPYREAVLPWLLTEGLVETISPAGAGSDGGADSAGSAGSTAIRRVRRPLAELFDKRLRLAPGELVLRFLLPAEWAAAPEADGRRSGSTYGPRTAAGQGWFYQRRTKDPRVDYPLVTLAMVELDGEARVALSGAWGYPARATALEEAIREAGGAAAFLDRAGTAPGAGAGNAGHGTDRIGAALDAEGRGFREDHRGSAAYRRELAIQAIGEGLAHMTAANGATR